MSAKAIKLELRRALPVIIIGLALGFISAVQMFYYLQANYNSFLANGPGVFTYPVAFASSPRLLVSMITMPLLGAALSVTQNWDLRSVRAEAMPVKRAERRLAKWLIGVACIIAPVVIAYLGAKLAIGANAQGIDDMFRATLSPEKLRAGMSGLESVFLFIAAAGLAVYGIMELLAQTFTRVWRATLLCAYMAFSALAVASKVTYSFSAMFVEVIGQYGIILNYARFSAYAAIAVGVFALTLLWAWILDKTRAFELATDVLWRGRTRVFILVVVAIFTLALIGTCLSQWPIAVACLFTGIAIYIVLTGLVGRRRER